ncbi:MAG: hypothetical protein AAGD12_07425 [Pseudomonadota bacterium]
MLGQTHPPSWSKIADVMGTVFPQQAGEIYIDPTADGHAHLTVAGLALHATFVPFPQTSLETPEHAAHVAVFAETVAAGPADRRAVARAVSLVAASLAMRRDCAGVIWNEVQRIVPPARARKAAARLDRGQDPFALWIDIASHPVIMREDDAAAAEPLAAACTNGLWPFFGCELELEAGPEAADEQSRILGAVLAQIFQDGEMIANGASFRIENAGDFVAALEPMGEVFAGPVCRLRRLPSPEEASVSVTGGVGTQRRFSAIVLFDPQAVPQAADIIRAVERQTKKLGVVPTLGAKTSDRLVADWGVVRGGGARKSEIIHQGWTLPEPLLSFIMAESGDVVLRNPDLLDGSVPVLIREMHSVTPTEPSILGATLLTGLSGALLTLPGARGVVWPSSGIVMTKSEAEEHLRRSGSGLPIALCVARLALELEGGRQVFVTRGLAELGERNILMTMDDPSDQRMREVFDSLVRASFERELVRRGDVFVNDRDGARFEVEEVMIEGIGPVLKARMVAPPKPSSGLGRFLRKR